MKIGENVKCKEYPNWGIGKIVSIQHAMGTCLVRWEHGCEYHIPWALVKT